MELILSVTERKSMPRLDDRRRFARRSAGSILLIRRHGTNPILNLRIGISELGQIGRSRPGVQFGEQSVIERLRFQLGHLAVRFVDIAEDNRLGRTGRLASGHDLAVAHLAIFFFRGRSSPR